MTPRPAPGHAEPYRDPRAASPSGHGEGSVAGRGEADLRVEAALLDRGEREGGVGLKGGDPIRITLTVADAPRAVSIRAGHDEPASGNDWKVA